jgi:hypothetical protein
MIGSELNCRVCGGGAGNLGEKSNSDPDFTARFGLRPAKALGRRVTPRAPGRPPKQGADARQMKLL